MMAGAQAIDEDASSEPARYREAHALLEKTIFRVDVAWLHVRFGAETTRRLDSLLSEPPSSRSQVEAAVDAAIRTRDAQANLVFQRNVGFERFIEGIQDGVEVARKAGILDPVFARNLSDSLPVWYAPLRERGVRDGDVTAYSIRGDTLHTVFRSAEGNVFVDQRDIGSQPRLSVMGGFLAPGSDFRERLLESLLDSEGGKEPPESTVGPPPLPPDPGPRGS